MVLRMEMNNSAEAPSFSARIGLAWKVLVNAAFAARVDAALTMLTAQETRPAAPTPERVHASGLLVLSALQREGRLIDFLQQDVAGFSDEEVGAAGRVIHSGCSKVLRQYFDFEPAVPGLEGTPMSVPAGFDAQRIRLTGNVTGQPPFKGILRHHGWVAKEVRLPEVSPSLDPKVVAPAEVELG